MVTAAGKAVNADGVPVNRLHELGVGYHVVPGHDFMMPVPRRLAEFDRGMRLRPATLGRP